MSDWQLPLAKLSDAALIETVVAVGHERLAGPFAAELGLNAALGIEVHALRRIEQWRVLLLLTPWLFARMLFPEQPPAGLNLPESHDRATPDVILGPLLRFSLFDQPQQAHLNYHPRLGHHLLQPICLDMTPYANAEAVFSAWQGVIRTRDAHLARGGADCPLQREISRRELFTRACGRHG